LPGPLYGWPGVCHREQVPPFRNAFGAVAAPAGEPGARAGDEHLHGTGDRDLGGVREGSNPAPARTAGLVTARPWLSTFYSLRHQIGPRSWWTTPGAVPPVAVCLL
jgi:hypothetical protein